MNTAFCFVSVSAASHDALPDLRPGDQLRSPHRRRPGWGDRHGRVRHPHERRPYGQGLRPRRRPPHLAACHRSLQHAAGAEEPPRAAQRQPGHGVHLLGTQQLHEARRQRPGVQQPEADESGAAETQSLHHLLAEDAAVWRTLQEGNRQRQVRIRQPPRQLCIILVKVQKERLEVSQLNVSYNNLMRINDYSV